MADAEKPPDGVRCTFVLDVDVNERVEQIVHERKQKRRRETGESYAKADLFREAVDYYLAHLSRRK